MGKVQITIAILAAALLFPLAPLPSQGAEFNKDFIISDAEFTDGTSMSAAKIQEFLNFQTGILKSFSMKTADGTTKTAAQIIADASVKYQISPRVLLTLIQKESSMLSRTIFPSGQQYYLDWVVFYGWCDSCSTGTFKGFENQMNAAASAFRRYTNNVNACGRTLRNNSGTCYGFGPNIQSTVRDCVQYGSNGSCSNWQYYQVTPVNTATAALYTYTPHVASAGSFTRIWNGYNFGYRRLYPDGSLLRAKGSATIYLIQNGVKRPFVSTAAFLSRYSYTNVIPVSNDQLFFYENGRSIKYANYSLLRTPNGVIFLLVDDAVRPIAGMKTFAAAGFQREEIVKVGAEDLAEYTKGELITMENIYPSGRLMQSRSTGVIFFVQDGIRHLVPSKQIYKSQFGKRRAIPATEAVLQQYPMGDPVGFKDGELVQHSSGGPVYFISNGQRREIADWNAAKAYKFDLIWKNLIKTTVRSLNVHPLGEKLRAEPEAVVQIASQ